MKREKGGAVVEVGPRSVGYKLTQKALAFGGTKLTATDIALIDGHLPEGIEGMKLDVESLKKLVDPDLVEKAIEKIKEKVETGIDRMKLNPDPVDVILVGGGSILLRSEDLKRIQGAGQVIRPDYYAIANAIGAAIAQVSLTLITTSILLQPFLHYFNTLHYIYIYILYLLGWW